MNKLRSVVHISLLFIIAVVLYLKIYNESNKVIKNDVNQYKEQVRRKTEVHPSPSYKLNSTVVESKKNNNEQLSIEELKWNGPLVAKYKVLILENDDNPDIKVKEIVGILRDYVEDKYLLNSDILKDAIMFVGANSFQKQLIKDSMKDPDYIAMVEDMYAKGVTEVQIDKFKQDYVNSQLDKFQMLEDQKNIYSMRFTMNHNVSGNQLVEDLSSIHTILPRVQINIPPRAEN